MKRLPLILALVAAPLTSLAQSPPPPAPQGAAPLPHPPALFVSPSGEPFRLTPGGGDPFDAWFARADANHDGRIDRTEFRTDARAFFKVVDTNGDGVIDGFEVTNYERKIAPELVTEIETRMFGPQAGGGQSGGGERGGRGGRRGGGGRGGGQRTGAPAEEPERPAGPPREHVALLDEPEPVSGADFDLDGRVTAAEWLRAADRRFDLLDDKHVGYLTRDALFAKLPKPPKPKKKR